MRQRADSSLDLPAEPLREGELKQAWIYRQIRARIFERVLPAGTRLPSTRTLAQRWHVARITVELAYDQLRSEGYLVSRGGSGTYVAAVIPEEPVPVRTSAPSTPNGAKQRIDIAPLTLNALGQPFVARIADPSLFPLADWRRALMASTKRVTGEQLADRDPFGLRELREQMAHYLSVSRGISCDAEQILVLSGIRDGLDLSARHLVSSSDTVLIEDPGYLHAAPIFGRYTRKVVPIPVDASGFSVAHARRRSGVKLVHVTPAHQSPTGVTMPVSRRLELLAWASEVGCWVLEDDYDSEFSYDSAPLPALKSLDTTDRVIHCGSFNKTMFAGLRIGYAVLPRTLVSDVRVARQVTGHANGVIEQLALAAFIESGAFARHVRRARMVYAARRDAVLHTLREAVGQDRLHVTGAHAGFHLVWWLPPDIDAPAFTATAQAHGLRFQSVSDFCRRAALPPGLVIGFTGLHDHELRHHLNVLRRLIEASSSSARSSTPSARPSHQKTTG